MSNFSRQLKLKPGIDDDHRVIAALSNDLWFRGMEIKKGREREERTPRRPESPLRKDPGEATQAIDDIVWEHCDEGENRNGTDCSSPWKTEVNLVTALGFYSMFGSLESLLNLEQKHEMQTEQKHIGKWREAIEDEMNIRHSETNSRPSGARYLVGSTLASMCKSRYPVHFVAMDVKSTRTIVDQAFSVPKCVRLARMSEKPYELLCKMFSAVPERTKEELESILGKKFMGYASGNFSDFERQKQ